LEEIVFARKFVTALALASAVAAGTTGCSLTNNIPTLQTYAPSDGSQIDLGGVKAINVIYLTKQVEGAEEREVGAIIGTFVNNTSSPVTIHLQFDEDSSEDPSITIKQTFDWESQVIPAGGKLDLGYNETPALSAILLKGEKVARPGDNVVIKIESSTGKGFLNVTALDGSLEQYTALVENLGSVDEHSAE
jgi:hypothetical protein